MANLTPTKHDASTINGGVQLQNGDVPQKEVFNYTIENSLYAVEVAEDVRDSIVSKKGTVVFENGQPQVNWDASTKLNKNAVVGTTGQSTTDVMNQKAVTDELNKKQAKLSQTQINNINDVQNKQPKGDYATNTALNNGLKGKQNTLSTTQINNINAVPNKQPKGHYTAQPDVNNFVDNIFKNFANSDYTAPDDGWIALVGKGNNRNEDFLVYSQGARFTQMVTGNCIYDFTYYLSMPVYKGVTYHLYSSVTPTQNMFFYNKKGV